MVAFSSLFINIDPMGIIYLVVTLILWIEMLLWLRLFSVIAINIFIFGNLLKKITPFFTFMFILIIGFANSILFLPYELINPSNSEDAGPIQEDPAGTIWDAILSMYYLSTINLNSYSDDSLFKLFTFVANVVIVLVLFNMIIALMKLDIPFNGLQLHDSPYICYLQDPNLMKKWMKKSQELRKTKLYSWFKESVDKENITYDGVDITSWYELISSNENQDSISTPDHMTLWF
ncbi:unnamed protein product [Rhizophagus irregularis]|uniref:Ion transport domain-containing protein n=1 Tax=Rhizophagus irregularis TaxID=588596 RepID=A0A2I1FYW7_9GLOM|nr:hypothetical protein RhiirA4_452780 [Rhizophagus irregularis]CAB4436760.1 unnamed protein product [Rhizophagus irregularis]